MQISRTILENLNACSFEVGPIRPPSEACSLLIRATRNCPWNKCAFCPVYKNCKFELRSVDELEKDIQAAKVISEEIRALSWKAGFGGRLRELAAAVCSSPQCNAGVRNVSLWLYSGAESAFLQDANSLIMRTPDLVRVLRSLRVTFPDLASVTSYARSKTAAKKSAEEMVDLSGAGLSRLHIGLETGCDELLTYMQKGATSEEHIKGGKRVKDSGISLCLYVMPGLGGRKLSKKHVECTASVLNEIEPDYIRLRTLEVREGMPLLEKLQEGDFSLQTEDEVAEEVGDLIERLECRSELQSDHVLNLLPEVEGKLPEDKDRILAIIKRYLSLPRNVRVNFQLGRRAGYYEGLDELQDAYKYEKVEQVIKRVESKGRSDGVQGVISALKSRFI